MSGSGRTQGCAEAALLWSRGVEKAIVLLLPVCMAREERVPRQSSLPHLAQLVNNNPGAIWHFNAPSSRLQRSRGGIAGQRVAFSQEQTLLKADERVKVRGQSVSISLSSLLCAAWLLPLPAVPP